MTLKNKDLISIKRCDVCRTKNQEVIPHSTEGGDPYPSGDPVSLDGVMSISMVVERNHSSHTFYVRDSQLTWFHPFKKNVFKMSLGGGVTDDLLDYIVREIKFAVKKRGNRIRGAAYKVV